MLVAVVAYCIVLGAIAATAVAATKGRSEARKRNISANGQVRQPPDPRLDTTVYACLPGLWDISPLHEGVIILTEGPPCVMYTIMPLRDHQSCSHVSRVPSNKCDGRLMVLRGSRHVITAQGPPSTAAAHSSQRQKGCGQCC